MSAAIVPILALGGVYLLYNSMSKKDKKEYKKLTNINTNTNTRKNKKKKNSSAKLTYNTENIKINKLIKIYVYYSLGKNRGKKWKYNNLAKGWDIKSTTDIIDKSMKYNKLVVFRGPKDKLNEMKDYLKTAFDFLKNKNIIKYFKITDNEI